MRLLRFLIDLLQLIDSTEIHILPLLNADGAAQSKDGCDSQAGRSNANNVDLDKNFPGPQLTPHNPPTPSNIF